MIFLNLFLTFSKIGAVNFGGGYAMLSLIQGEVVERHQWLSNQEFTDLVAISQVTPGPIGVNVATYVGYSATIAEGYPPILGVLGALIATLSVLWIPFLIMLMLSLLILKYKEHRLTQAVFAVLRPAIVGLIATAALLLITPENFGVWAVSPWQVSISSILFLLAFLAVYRYKQNPLLVMGLAALVGVLLYPWI